MIYWKVREYEKEIKKNQSTYWLIFELIWRDFFKYISIKHGNKIFRIGKQPMLTLPEIAKAMKDNTLIMDTLLKLPFMKSALAIKAGVQMNKTVLSLMTQMRNITTAAMFATANGHIGKGASVADNFRILFDDLTGKNKDPQKLKEVLS